MGGNKPIEIESNQINPETKMQEVMTTYSASNDSIKPKSIKKKQLMLAVCALLIITVLYICYHFGFYLLPLDGYPIGYSAKIDYNETLKAVKHNLPAEIQVTSNFSSDYVILFGSSKHARVYNMSVEITFPNKTNITLHYTTQYGETMAEGYKHDTEGYEGEPKWGARLSLIGSQVKTRALVNFINNNGVTGNLMLAGRDDTNDYLDVVKDNPNESKDWLFINDANHIYVVKLQGDTLEPVYKISHNDGAPEQVAQMNLINNSLTIDVGGDKNNLVNPVEIFGQAVSDVPIESVYIKCNGEWYKALSRDNSWGKITVNYHASFNLQKGKYVFESKMLDKSGKTIKVSQDGRFPSLTLEFK